MMTPFFWKQFVMESRVTVTFSLPSLAKTVKASFSIRCNIKFWSWPVSSRYLYDRRACQLVYTYSPIEGNSWGDEINRRGGIIYRLLQDHRRICDFRRYPHLVLLLLLLSVYLCVCLLSLFVCSFILFCCCLLLHTTLSHFLPLSGLFLSFLFVRVVCTGIVKRNADFNGTVQNECKL